jgi:hypothetical protein
MRKEKLFLAALIGSMALVSCGGEEEKAPKKEVLNEWSDDSDQSDEEETDVSMDETEVETSEEESPSDEWNEVLDGYEDYVDDYSAILKKQKADPTDMSIMTEYQALMQKGSEWSTKMSEMSSSFGPEQLTRMQSIQSKLMSAAGM